MPSAFTSSTTQLALQLVSVLPNMFFSVLALQLIICNVIVMGMLPAPILCAPVPPTAHAPVLLSRAVHVLQVSHLLLLSNLQVSLLCNFCSFCEGVLLDRRPAHVDPHLLIALALAPALAPAPHPRPRPRPQPRLARAGPTRVRNPASLDRSVGVATSGPTTATRWAPTRTLKSS